MKKLFFSFILIFTFSILSAQSSAIKTRIEKVPDGNLTWIKLTITNKSSNPIIISDMCRLSSQGKELGQSTSYAMAMSYDRSGKPIGNSSKLYFISFDKNNGINLRKGESEVQVFLLKSEEIPGFYAKNFSERNIQNLQLKIHLTYKTFVPNGILTSKEDLYTNQIRL